MQNDEELELVNRKQLSKLIIEAGESGNETL